MWRTPDTPVQRRRLRPTTSSSTSAPGACRPGAQVRVGEPQPQRGLAIHRAHSGRDKRQHPHQEPARSFFGAGWWGRGRSLQNLGCPPASPFFPTLGTAMERSGDQDGGLWWTPEAEPKFCGVIYSGSQSDLCYPDFMSRAEPSGPAAA